jgi:hypothetical protein
MTQSALGALLPGLLADLQSLNGFWRGQREGVPIYVLCDETHNRVRIMAPVGELRSLDKDFLTLLLRANFDRALDSRYALRGKELWSVFVHPLSTLVSDDLGLCLDQVVRLVKNTGTTYASTELVFGIEGDDSEDIAANYQTDVFDEDDEENRS